MGKDVPGKKHIFLKILLAILVILLLLIGIVVGFVWSKMNLIQYDDMSSQILESPAETAPGENSDSESFPSDGEEDALVDISGLDMVEDAPVVPEGDVAADDHIFNILILGTDERSKDFSTNARSDCMILVSIDKEKNTVKLVSLERGMGVPVLEGQYKGQYDWLTHMFRYGGADLVMKTVEHCFKVDVDHYVRFNFTAVTQVVDAIGGIDVELSSAEAGKIQYTQPGVTAGMNHLNGNAALAFARLRSIDSDWQRVQRQRKVIIALVNELKGSSLSQLNGFVNQILPMIRTNLTKLEMAELMVYAPNLLNATIEQMTIPKSGTYGGMRGMGGRSLYAVDFDANAKILQDFLYGE